MITEPKLEDRDIQHYVGIRSQATMQELPAAIDQLGEVFSWLKSKGEAPIGAPFIRYLVIDMEALLEIEVGVPVARALSGDGRICTGVLPTGRYASLVYTGIANGIQGNGALLKWGAEQGLVWDSWKTEKGDACKRQEDSEPHARAKLSHLLANQSVRTVGPASANSDGNENFRLP